MRKPRPLPPRGPSRQRSCPAAGRRRRRPTRQQLVGDLRSPDAEKSGRARAAAHHPRRARRPCRRGDCCGPARRPSGSLAANTLWGMGARGRAAVPDLAAALADPDPDLRVASAMALENMGPAAAPAVPALAKALGDREPGVRQAAVKALGAIGPEARAALPALIRILRRGSWPEARGGGAPDPRPRAGSRRSSSAPRSRGPVSLAGRLEEIELAEVLHFLALNNRTGKVTLSRRDAHGLVVVRLGRIVYAASSSIRETLRQHPGLPRASCRPRRSPRRSSGSTARPTAASSATSWSRRERSREAQLQEALRQQTGLVVQELCRWRERLLPLRGRARGLGGRHRRRRRGAGGGGGRRHRPDPPRGDGPPGRGRRGADRRADAPRHRLRDRSRRLSGAR